MHPLFLVNEGTVAVAMMAVALFIAFGMVIGLGAYVIYCDTLNRAGEARLGPAHAPPRGGRRGGSLPGRSRGRTSRLPPTRRLLKRDRPRAAPEPNPPRGIE